MRQTTTIQETHKDFKGWLVLAWLLAIIGGTIWVMGGSGFGGTMVGAALLLWVLTRMCIWWHHA